MVSGETRAPQEDLAADERILRATIDGLAELNPDALRIQQICRKAAVTPPTIYYHFGNKDGMVAAAVERLVTDWLELMNAAVSREGGLEQTLQEAIEAWESTITAPTRPIAVFAWATLLLAESSDACRDALLKARDTSLRLSTEVLANYLDEESAGYLAGVVVDAVVAAALQYELDRDRAALRRRLAVVGHIVGAASPAAAD